MLITITNNGPDIITTNYFDTPHAAQGKLYCTINAGTFRLLVPPSLEREIAEWKTSREVIVSRGPWPAAGKADALELLFEDGTDNPYAVHLSSEQMDRMPQDADRDRSGQPPRWHFAAWTANGKQLELPCRYRVVKKIPCLKEWK